MIIIDRRAFESPLRRETKSQRAHHRQIEIYQRDKAKKEQQIFRGLLKRLDAAKRRLMRITAADCAQLREKAKKKKGLRRRAAAADASAVCATRKGQALLQFSVRFRKLAEEILFLRETVLAVRRPTSPRKGPKGERRKEAFELEGANIAPELQPLWRKIGRQAQFAPTAHADRWELFTKYVEENPEEVYGAMYAAADADAADWLKELEKEYAQGVAA